MLTRCIQIGHIRIMKLATWMHENGIDDDLLSYKMGGSVSAIQKWRLGLRIPRALQLLRFLEITAGEVTPNDFFWKYISNIGDANEEQSND